MKASGIILLSLSAAFVIIGTHQTIKNGIVVSYPFIMLAVVFLFWYKYRQNQRAGQEEEPDQSDLKRKRK
jgi:hypothetical protein